MKDRIFRHHRFYLPPGAIGADKICFPEHESSHMVSSLRIRKGDHVSVTDGRGRVYDIAIEEATKPKVRGRIVGRTAVEPPQPAVALFQGIVKPARMDLIIEKCVELGVSSVVPVYTDRCVRHLGARRLERLERIAVEAMKQSLGAYLPDLCSPRDFTLALSMASQFDLTVVAWEGEKRQRLRDVLEAREAEAIALWIGPEGGFTQDELGHLKEQGAVTFSLGERRLKAETAAIASIAILSLGGCSR